MVFYEVFDGALKPVFKVDLSRPFVFSCLNIFIQDNQKILNSQTDAFAKSNSSDKIRGVVGCASP